MKQKYLVFCDKMLFRKKRKLVRQKIFKNFHWHFFENMKFADLVFSTKRQTHYIFDIIRYFSDLLLNTTSHTKKNHFKH